MNKKIISVFFMLMAATSLFAQAIQTISVGTSANDGTGDSLRTAGQKINANFAAVQSAVSGGTNGLIGYGGKEYWISTNATGVFITNGVALGVLDGSLATNFDYNMNNIPAFSLVHLAAGTFQTTGAKNWFAKSGQRIVGAGMYATTLQVPAQSVTSGYMDQTYIIGVASPFLQTNILVSDLTLDSNYQPGSLITLDGMQLVGSHNTIQRVRWMNGASFTGGPYVESWGIIISSIGNNYPWANARGNLIQDCRVEKFTQDNVNNVSAIGLVGNASGWVVDNYIAQLGTNSVLGIYPGNKNSVVQGNVMVNVDVGLHYDSGQGGYTNIVIQNNQLIDGCSFIDWNNGDFRNIGVFNNIVTLTNKNPRFNSNAFIDIRTSTGGSFAISGNSVQKSFTGAIGELAFMELTSCTGVVATANFIDTAYSNVLTTCSNVVVNCWDLSGAPSAMNLGPVYFTNVTVLGDVTGSANAPSSITATMKNTGTAGTYRSVTFDPQGRETAGSNPTTFAGYGISDTSANLLAALTTSTGTGLNVFGTSPTLTTANVNGLTNSDGIANFFWANDANKRMTPTLNALSLTNVQSTNIVGLISPTNVVMLASNSVPSNGQIAFWRWGTNYAQGYQLTNSVSTIDDNGAAAFSGVVTHSNSTVLQGALLFSNTAANGLWQVTNNASKLQWTNQTMPSAGFEINTNGATGMIVYSNLFVKGVYRGDGENLTNENDAYTAMPSSFSLVNSNQAAAMITALAPSGGNGVYNMDFTAQPLNVGQANTFKYFSPVGALASGTEALCEWPIPYNMTLSNLQIRITRSTSGALQSGTNTVFYIFTNGGQTTFTMSFLSDGTKVYAQDSTHSLYCPSNTMVSIGLTNNSGNGDATEVNGSLRGY